MGQRFFTSDWHLNHGNIIKYCNRQFKSVKRMNDVLIKFANDKAKHRSDIIIHVGDFYCYGSDRGSESVKENPSLYIDRLTATFVNIKGNHDRNNKVTSLCDHMITNVGPFRVHVCHHPSNDHNSRVKNFKHIILICGHVHNKWKHFYDKERDILNINVGVDAWKNCIVSESEIVNFINKLAQSDSNINKLINRFKDK